MNNLMVVFTNESNLESIPLSMDKNARKEWGQTLKDIDDKSIILRITYPKGSPKVFVDEVLPSFKSLVDMINDYEGTNIQVIEGATEYVKGSFGGSEITDEVFMSDEYLKDYGINKGSENAMKAWKKALELKKQVVALDKLMRSENLIGKGANFGMHFHKIKSRRTSKSK